MGLDNDVQIPKEASPLPLQAEGENPGAPKMPFIRKCDRFLGGNKGVFSLLTGFSTVLFHFTPLGVVDTAGKTMLGATAVAYATLKIFEQTKPKEAYPASTLNLLHHFIVITLPITAGLLTTSLLGAYVAKNVLVGLSLLASTVYVVANWVFPPMDHKKVYRGLGLV
jgi:hypothetical protein